MGDTQEGEGARTSDSRPGSPGKKVAARENATAEFSAIIGIDRAEVVPVGGSGRPMEVLVAIGTEDSMGTEMLVRIRRENDKDNLASGVTHRAYGG